MGWWKSQNGVIGDRPADILHAALNAIEHIYVQESGRRPTQGELADLIQFCSAGVFEVQCGDTKYAFSKHMLHYHDTPRRCKPGAQGASGIANRPKAGELGNVDPKTGDHMEAGELKEVLADQVKKASGSGQRIPDAEGSP